ncbi:anti-sigma factor [soil metagenome]
MNPKKYISSGILESYVLGELSTAEVEGVENNARNFPEIREEIQKIEEVFHQIADSNSRTPRPGTKEALFLKIEALDNPQVETVHAKVLPINSQVNRVPGQVMWYWAAAAGFLAVISSFAAIHFFSKWRNSESRLATIVVANAKLAQDYDAVSRRYDLAQRDLSIINQPDFNRIELAGLPISPESQAQVYWNEESEEVFLNVAYLPDPPADRQYQLWAIVDGAPVDAGVFSPDQEQGLLKMKNINNASAFAVTLEPTGGSASPTMDAMYVIGNVDEA